jgi:hypothetical protein
LVEGSMRENMGTILLFIAGRLLSNPRVKITSKTRGSKEPL